MSITPLNLPRVLFGAGALAALPAEFEALGIRRPLLVTDQGLVKAGIAAKALAAIGAGGPAACLDNVTENPLYADVDAGALLYARHECDGIVALGGGSVIDTAKCISLLATHPGSMAEFIGSRQMPQRPGAPLIAIPTTAGTGSEASPSAGIHPDAATAAVGLASRHIIARVAILDPELTLSLPPRLTAATGIDAISHCIEGYLSRNDMPLGETIALDGLQRAVRHIRRAAAEGGDLAARGEMMLAAFAGGASIGMGLGPAHAIALACSDQGFHHGVLSGIGLVATLGTTARHEPERVAEVARAFGAAPGEPLQDAIASLMRELGLPASLRELGYAATDLKALGQAGHQSHFNKASRYHPSAADYEQMMAASLA